MWTEIECRKVKLPSSTWNIHLPAVGLATNHPITEDMNIDPNIKSRPGGPKQCLVLLSFREIPNVDFLWAPPPHVCNDRLQQWEPPPSSPESQAEFLLYVGAFNKTGCSRTDWLYMAGPLLIPVFDFSAHCIIYCYLDLMAWFHWEDPVFTFNSEVRRGSYGGGKSRFKWSSNTWTKFYQYP